MSKTRTEIKKSATEATEESPVIIAYKDLTAECLRGLPFGGSNV